MAIRVTERRPPATADVPACPYQGLMPYTERDASFFYGRDQDSRLIVDNLRAYRLSVLYGPSGVGKSSVLQAGVLRLIRDETERKRERFGVVEGAPAYCNEWREEPSRTLATVISSALSVATGRDQNLPLDRLDGAAVVQACADQDIDLLIILDQFEEYFLYHETDDDSFDRQLATLLVTGSRASVLIAIREDGLAKLDRFEAALPGVFDNTLRLEHLDRASANEAVVEPLHRFNSLVAESQQRTIEASLVETLLDQVETGRVRVSSTGGEARVTTSSEGGGRIEAPFLQLVLMRLWEEESAAGSTALRLSTLERLGGAESIVREHLDRVVAGFDASEHEVLADIFGQLVTPGGTKIAHTASDLAAIGGVDLDQVRQVLQRLCRGDQRILREVHPPGDDPDAEPRFEVFHDVLALAVLDWRRRWTAEHERLREQQALIAGKDEAERHAQESRHRLRRTRVVAGSLVLLLITSLLFVALTVRESQRAERSLDLAAQREMLTEVRRQALNDPAAAHATALAAWRQSNDGAAEEALRRTFDTADTDLVLDVASDPVMSATFIRDGTGLATSSEDGHLRVWDSDSGDLVADVDAAEVAGTTRLQPAQITADEKFAVVGTNEGNAVVAPLDGADPVLLRAEGMDGVVAAAVPESGRRNTVITSSYGTGAHIWDVATGELLHTLGGPTDSFGGATLDASGRFAATWSWTGVLAVWDTSTGDMLEQARYSSPVGMMQFVPSRPGIVVGLDTLQTRPIVWRWRRSEQAESLGGFHSHGISSIEFDSQGTRMAVAGDKEAFVYGLDGSLLNRAPGARDWVIEATFSPDGHYVASITNDGEVRLDYADRVNNRPLWVFRGHGAAVNDVEFSPDGERLVTAGTDGTVRVWRLPRRTVVWGGQWQDWMLAAEFSADGSELVIGSSTGQVSFVDTSKGAVTWTANAFEGELYEETLQSLALSPNGDAVAVAAFYKNVPVVVRRDGQDPPDFSRDADEAAPMSLSRVRWSSDEAHPLVVAGDGSNQILAWDPSAGGEPQWRTSLGRDNMVVRDLNFSGDARVLVAVSQDQQLRVLDPTSGDVTRSLLVGATTSVGVSQDGRFVATAGVDQTVRVWDLEAGGDQPIHEFTDPAGTIGEVTFSRDNEATFVAAVGSDGITYVWDRETGDLRAALHRHGDAVNAVDLHPEDETRVATASDDGTVAIYSCTPCDLEGDELDDAAQDRLALEPEADAEGVNAAGRLE